MRLSTYAVFFFIMSSSLVMAQDTSFNYQGPSALTLKEVNLGPHCAFQHIQDCGVEMFGCLQCCLFENETQAEVDLCSNTCLAMDELRERQCDERQQVLGF